MPGRARSDESGGVSYRRFLSDPSVLSVFLVGFVAVFGMSAVPVALPSIASAFELSDTQVGLVMTAFYLPMIVMTPVTSVLTDLYGRRRIVVPSLVLFGLSGVAMLGVTTFQGLLLLRVLQGISASPTIPLTAAMVGDLYQGAEGVAAQGMRMSLSSLAGTIGPLLAGVVVVFAWYHPFVLFGLALPAAAVVSRNYADPISTDRAETGSRREIRREVRSYALSLTSQMNDRTFGILTAGGFTLFFMKQAVKTFVPLFAVRELGASAAAVGVILAVYGLMRMVVAPLTGSLQARLSRRTVMLLAIVTVGTATLAIPYTRSLLVLDVAVGLFAVGEALLNPSLNDAVAAYAGDSERGGVLSGMQSLKNVANTVSPAVLGVVLAHSNFTLVYLIPTAMIALYGLGFLLLFDPRRLR